MIEEDMAKEKTKSTMKGFTTNDHEDYYSGITCITVNGKNAYELKGKFLDDLHNNAFDGPNGEEAVKHIGYFLRIVDPIDLPNFVNYKTMDIFTKGALWDYWKIGSDEIEPTDDESSNLEETDHDDEQEIEWPTCSWKNDGYCNGGNLLGAFIIGNSLHYQDYEWYEALEDSELKEQALRNKAIMEGLISDDESSNDGWGRWESHEITYHDHDELEYKNETNDERQELCEAHELPVCNIRRFEMIKYSSRQDEEYVAIKEDEYDDLARTRNDACRAYQEIFRMMNEG
ncbi:hypothetical protein Tco_1032181 [Tanacetum coccineum]|uniref:Uncharacterized protein n=1 Tax=Tanacetum coccineum TaxID=301880 RepID=A0ABQ5GBN1_9ASTR